MVIESRRIRRVTIVTSCYNCYKLSNYSARLWENEKIEKNEKIVEIKTQAESITSMIATDIVDQQILMQERASRSNKSTKNSLNLEKVARGTYRLQSYFVAFGFTASSRPRSESSLYSRRRVAKWDFNRAYGEYFTDRSSAYDAI